jgi:hypothetical protein
MCVADVVFDHLQWIMWLRPSSRCIRAFSEILWPQKVAVVFNRHAKYMQKRLGG